MMSEASGDNLEEREDEEHLDIHEEEHSDIQHILEASGDNLEEREDEEHLDIQHTLEASGDNLEVREDEEHLGVQHTMEASGDNLAEREDEEHLDIQHTMEASGDNLEVREEEEHLGVQADSSDQHDSSNDEDDDDSDDDDDMAPLPDIRPSNRHLRAALHVERPKKPSSDLIENISKEKIGKLVEKETADLHGLCRKFEVVKRKYGRDALEVSVWWSNILEHLCMQAGKLPSADEVQQIAEQLENDEHVVKVALEDVKRNIWRCGFDIDAFESDALNILRIIQDCGIAFGAFRRMWTENMGVEYRGGDEWSGSQGSALQAPSDSDLKNAQAAFEYFNTNLKGQGLKAPEDDCVEWWRQMQISLKALAVEPAKFCLMVEEGGGYVYSRHKIKWKKENGQTCTTMWHNLDTRHKKTHKYVGTVWDMYSYKNEAKDHARRAQVLYDKRKVEAIEKKKLEAEASENKKRKADAVK